MSYKEYNFFNNNSPDTTLTINGLSENNNEIFIGIDELLSSNKRIQAGIFLNKQESKELAQRLLELVGDVEGV